MVSDILQVMDMFQGSLLNEGFELIAAETLRGDPKSHIESLKVSLSLNKSIFYNLYMAFRNPRMPVY